MACDGREQIRLGHIPPKCIKKPVYTRRTVVMNISFIAHDTRLHAQYIVLRRFFIVGIIAFKLHLLRFKIVAGVELVRNGERNNMQIFQSVDGVTLSANSHHFQNRLLRAVVRVFGATFALCNPDIFVLFVDGIVHIFRKQFAGSQHLSDRQITFNNKRFIHSYKVFHPRKRQQIVADGYFASCIKTIINEKFGQKSRVENDVAMIAQKGITPRMVNSRNIHIASFAGLRQ